jgi:serine/threonine protein kinase
LDVAAIAVELGALQAESAQVPLSEKDYLSLHDRMQVLSDRLLAYIWRLLEAPECDLGAVEEVDQLRKALRAVMPAPMQVANAGGPALSPSDAYHCVEYLCGTVPITGLSEMFAPDEPAELTAPSARFMLRGTFGAVDALKSQLRYKKCVVKCASHSLLAEPSPARLGLICRERAMYEEVRRLAGKRETGCIRMYSAHPEHLYLVLEDHGTDLRGLLKSNLRSPQLVLEGMVAAVAALHALGVMHGDIKPQNFLYKVADYRYAVKLCDLDCAYKVGEYIVAQAQGTKAYLAPELRVAFRDKTAIKASLRIDMFALGLVIWQVLHRTPHPALEWTCDELYLDQDKLDAHLNYPRHFRWFMQAVTCLDPAQRINIQELDKSMQTTSATTAHNRFVEFFLSNLVSVLASDLGNAFQASDNSPPVQIGTVPATENNVSRSHLPGTPVHSAWVSAPSGQPLGRPVSPRAGPTATPPAPPSPPVEDTQLSLFEAECQRILCQVEEAPKRKECTERLAATEVGLAAATAARNITLCIKLKQRQIALQDESKALALSEEDFRTLGDRMQELHDRMVVYGEGLMQAHVWDFETLERLDAQRQKLYAVIAPPQQNTINGTLPTSPRL